MFRLRKKVPLECPVTLWPDDKLHVEYHNPDGTVEVLVEDFVQEGEEATYDTALVIDFQDEFGLKKGYMGGVAKEED